MQMCQKILEERSEALLAGGSIFRMDRRQRHEDIRATDPLHSVLEET